MNDLKKLIASYLKDAKLMQLSTSADNQPWACSVWFASDEDLNLYWFSSTERRHSKEVTKNPKVAGTIALTNKPEDAPRGIQFEGTAKLLTNQKDIDKAISVFENRIFPRQKIDSMTQSKGHRFYRIKPSVFVLLDPASFPENPKQELAL
jgi:uncharacterized protein YhbP (UPF0306 family)